MFFSLVSSVSQFVGTYLLLNWSYMETESKENDNCPAGEKRNTQKTI